MMAQRNSVTEVDDEERERRNRSEQTRREREEVSHPLDSPRTRRYTRVDRYLSNI